MLAHAADRVILDREALAPSSAAACRTGPVILAAKPIVSNGAEGERREPARTIRMPPGPGGGAPGRPATAAGCLEILSGPEPEDGPRPGSPSGPGRNRVRLPGASAPRRASTLNDTDVRENARGAAVISSPDLGVFAVTAAGPGSRRGHVICSGVLAVAAVAAAGISCPGPSAALPGDLR
jgi:hypothetical protein